VCYVTYAASESGVIDEIDNMDQEEEDILFWEQDDVLQQEYDKAIEDN